MADDAPQPDLAPYEFLQVNGFVYRGNRQTGELWKLEPSSSDKKTQVWKKIEVASGA